MIVQLLNGGDSLPSIMGAFKTYATMATKAGGILAKQMHACNAKIMRSSILNLMHAFTDVLASDSSGTLGMYNFQALQRKRGAMMLFNYVCNY